jgi:hypothetical protein
MMLDMAKPKKRKPGRPRREGVPLNIRLAPQLMQALEQLVMKSLRTKTVEVSEALKEYLAKHGLWPPSPKED